MKIGKMAVFMKHPLHVSWFIAGVAAGIIGGTALSGVLQVRFFGVVWLVLAAAVLLAALVRRQAFFIVGAMAFGMTLGLWRGALVQSSLTGYQPFYGKNVTLTGQVSEDATTGTGGDIRVMLKHVSIGGRELPGKVWINLASKGDVRRSDELTVSGKLGTGFGNIPASMFYANLVKIQRPRPGDIALRIRDWFSSGIEKAIPQPQASLGEGYLVGERSALPHSLDRQLKAVGLTHAVVASGYNLTILVVFARKLFIKKSKYLALLSAALMAGGFMLITGFSPSMTRAGIVVGLSLAAWYYGRSVRPMVLLLLAAAITVLINPAYVWGDIGWALSFAAFGGVLLLAPVLHRFFWGSEEPGNIRQVLVGTASAQLATMPIMIFAFGHYSPYALLANLLVLPLIPLAMALIFVAGVGGLALPALAHWIGYPATLVLHYMTSAVQYIANLPGAHGSLTINGLTLALSYLALAGITLTLWLKTDYKLPHRQQLGNIYEVA
jgi:competence protein ComEC